MAGFQSPVGGALQTFAATIAASASISGAIDLDFARPGAVYVPAGTQGAAITFQASSDGTTFADVYDSEGSELSVTIDAASAAQIVELPLTKLLWARHLKIRTGTSASPQTQSAARALVLLGA